MSEISDKQFKAILLIIVGAIIGFIGLYEIFIRATNTSYLLIGGLLLISLGISSFKAKKAEFICKECRMVYYKKHLKEISCPKCDVELERLDGFYERHPELKES